MIFIIDIGNTNTNFALFSGDQLQILWHTKTSLSATPDKYATLLIRRLKENHLDLTCIRGMGVSSVVPVLTPVIKNLAKRFLHIDPIVIGDPGIKTGLKILIDEPECVGADLISGAIAANQDHKMPALIIDFGTATTLVVTDADGNFCGGIVVPGIALMKNALFQGAAQLPDILLSFPPCVLGKDTITAMQSGILWGYVDLVNGLIARLFKEQQQTLPIILTGGFAKLIHSHIAFPNVLDPYLTLKGIYKIYKLNAVHEMSQQQQKKIQ